MKVLPQYLSLSKIFCALTLLCFCAVSPAFADGFSLGDSANYAVLYEGNGGNQLSITNVTVNGNIGVGGTGTVAFSGPGTINGSLSFSATNTGQFSNSNGMNVGPTSTNYNVTAVQNDLNYLNMLSSTLGGYAGPALNINLSGSTSLTINASLGNLVNGNEVFDITGFNTTNGNTLIINGGGLGHNVVFNFIGGSNINFNNQVMLTGGLTSDNVIFNFVGGSGLTGGPTLQINDNGNNNPQNLVQGVFLDPNGAISVVNANLTGRVFGGDTTNMQIVSGDTITSPAGVPEPSSTLLLGVGLCSVVGLRKRMFRK